MRKFWLETDTERIALQDDKLFFYGPEGLGFAEDREYESPENGFFELVAENFAQPEISGTLVFRKEPYQSYREFTDKVARAGRTMLVYRPYGSRDYYMDVWVDTIGKGEMSAGVLEAPVEMRGLTPWYVNSRLAFRFAEPEGAQPKRYNWVYDYSYNTSRIPGELEISPVEGHFSGGLRMEAEGPLAAPVLTLLNNLTGDVCGKLDLSAITIAEGEKVVYSSQIRETGVWRKKTDGSMEDLMEYVELYAGIPVFMRVPMGVTLKATLDLENAITNACDLYVYEYWKTR